MDRKGFLIRIGMAAALSLSGIRSFAGKVGKSRRDKGIEPKLANPASSSIFFVGDLQRYTKDTVFQPVSEMILSWIRKRHKYLNAKCALFTGDLVENNEYYKKLDFYVDVDSKGQWKFTSKNFERLDGELPYISCTGNHDYGIRCFENRNTHFNEIFKEGRNPLSDGILIEMFPNAFGKRTRENACYELDLGGKWGKVMVFSIEFCPRDEVLEWVHKKCVEDFADRKVFLLLHDYIKMDGSMSAKPFFKYVKVETKPEFNGGEDVWKKLVKVTPNIRLVLCGHAHGDTVLIDDNSYFRSDKNDAGKDVFSMVFAQHGRPNDGHGADGWVRILEFDPDGETVRVSTFSPYLFMSMDSKARSRPKNEKNEFSFKIQ